ncbi:hypothetical protein C8R45DRAFT_1008997, partial [Mycena sanguinolenta]
VIPTYPSYVNSLESQTFVSTSFEPAAPSPSPYIIHTRVNIRNNAGNSSNTQPHAINDSFPTITTINLDMPFQPGVSPPSSPTTQYPESLTELHVTYAYTSPPPALLMDAPRGTFFPPPSTIDLPLREDVPEVPVEVRDRLEFVRLPRTVNWGLTGSTDALPLPERDPPVKQSVTPVLPPPVPLPPTPPPPAPIQSRKTWRWGFLERIKHALQKRKVIAHVAT